MFLLSSFQKCIFISWSQLKVSCLFLTTHLTTLISHKVANCWSIAIHLHGLEQDALLDHQWLEASSASLWGGKSYESLGKSLGKKWCWDCQSDSGKWRTKLSASHRREEHRTFCPWVLTLQRWSCTKVSSTFLQDFPTLPCHSTSTELLWDPDFHLDVNQCFPRYRSPGYLHVLSAKEFHQWNAKFKKNKKEQNR